MYIVFFLILVLCRTSSCSLTFTSCRVAKRNQPSTCPKGFTGFNKLDSFLKGQSLIQLKSTSPFFRHKATKEVLIKNFQSSSDLEIGLFLITSNNVAFDHICLFGDALKNLGAN